MRTPAIDRRRRVSLDSLTLFATEAKRYQPLTKEEQLELGRRVRDGDELAARQQVNHCTMLALKVAQDVAKAKRCPGRVQELLSVGLERLAVCVWSFDPEQDVKFSSYAARCMECRMLSYLSEHTRSARIPKDAAAMVNRLVPFVIQHQEEHGGFPSLGLIASKEGISEAKAAELLPYLLEEVSLDASASHSGDGASQSEMIAGDTPASDMAAEQGWLTARIGVLLEARLTKREVFVVRSFFGLGSGRQLKLDEIGAVLRLHPERVRQIKNEALKRLKAAAGAETMWEDIAA